MRGYLKNSSNTERSTTPLFAMAGDSIRHEGLPACRQPSLSVQYQKFKQGSEIAMCA
jgi:hypothetical protein